MIGMSELLPVWKIFSSGSIGNKELRVFQSPMFLGEFSRSALCKSKMTYVAYIFYLVCFQMDLGFLPVHICFYFNLIQPSAKKLYKNVILLILSFKSQKNQHFLGLKIKRHYFNGGWKKSLTRNEEIFLYAALKHLSTTENQNKINISRTL